MHGAGSERDAALEEFYKQWKGDSLVMLKWIGLQVSCPIGRRDMLSLIPKGVNSKTVSGTLNSASQCNRGLCCMQAGANVPGNLKNVEKLLDHPAFSITNPNACYSLFLSFLRSSVNFHAADGSGYRFIADSVLKVGVGCGDGLDFATSCIELAL